MWQVPSSRIKLDLDGPSVEVERIHSWAVQYQTNRLYDALLAAKTSDAEYAALLPLIERFVTEAQPTWEISDPRGVVPCTPLGMLRLPIRLTLQMIEGWLNTLIVPSAEKPESAVDAVLPPGKARNEIKRRLRSVKAA